MSCQSGRRVEFIDYSKAIAIFLVVLGHTPFCNNTIKQWLYSFHMPFFFAVYGLTYNLEEHAKKGFFTVGFLKSKLRRLILPAMIWAIGYSILFGLLNNDFYLKNFLYIVYGSQASLKKADSLTSIWFLPCMFLAVCFTEIIFQLLNRPKIKRKYQTTMLIMLTVVLSVLSDLFPRMKNGYPWSGNIALMATAFILIGYLLRELYSKLPGINNGESIPWLTILGISFVLVAVLFKWNLKYLTLNNADMASGTYGNYLYYMLNSIFGIIMLIGISILLAQRVKSGLICFIGSNTMAIFLLHKPLVGGACDILYKLGFANWILSLPIAVSVLIFCSIWAWIIDRSIPEVVGNRRKECHE